ncbi:hypothetical protein [Geodermatophilus sp. FMUSA9-8]|uniref:hypothetical protein n=1 Tax=Geodermatophilus sp. FMUSA9-8 TaxID=3120155 RepID=UPI00300B88D0
MTAIQPSRKPNAWMYVEGPARRVLHMKLLYRRQHLAAAAAEHTAHGQVGAEMLWRAVDATEARLRHLFPDSWAQQHETWATTDAARMHTAADPRPVDCHLCVPNPPEATASSGS